MLQHSKQFKRAQIARKRAETKMCGTKTRFKNSGKAKRFLSRIGVDMHAYECPFCHHYHVGH